MSCRVRRSVEPFSDLFWEGQKTMERSSYLFYLLYVSYVCRLCFPALIPPDAWGEIENKKGGPAPCIQRGRNTNYKYTHSCIHFITPLAPHTHTHALSHLITACEHAIHQSSELVKGWMEPSSLQSELLDFPPVRLCVPVWLIVVVKSRL